MSTSLTEEVHAHVFVGGFLRFDGGWGSFLSSSGGGWSSDSEGLWVGEVLLELLNLWEGDLSDSGNGLDVLEGVGDAVRSRGGGWVADGQRDGSDVGDSAHESGLDVVLGDVEDLGGVDGASVVALDNVQTVGEGRDLQHVEESGGGLSDLVAGSDEVDGRGDFNVTTSNLGGDGKSLEEGGLFGTKSGDLGRDDDVDWGDSSGTGGGGNLVGHDQVSDLLHVSVEADEADVELDQVHELLELGLVTEEGSHGSLHHGVLAHEDLALASETSSDLLELLGSDVVSIADEDPIVGGEDSLDLLEVFGFPFLSNSSQNHS